MGRMPTRWRGADKAVAFKSSRALAVEALGGKIEHVIRTRMFIIDITKWEQVAKAHGEMFKDIRPATSLLEVSKLIDDDALIEIEADAVIPG